MSRVRILAIKTTSDRKIQVVFQNKKNISIFFKIQHRTPPILRSGVRIPDTKTTPDRKIKVVFQKKNKKILKKNFKYTYGIRTQELKNTRSISN